MLIFLQGYRSECYTHVRAYTHAHTNAHSKIEKTGIYNNGI